MRAAAPVALASALSLAFAGRADARAVRRLFEPTDIELEDAGTIELDLQAGVARPGPGWRLSIPDFELDVGLTRDLELDVDGAFEVADEDGAGPSGPRADADNLWLALKTSVASYDDDDRADDRWGLGLGMQIGPKLPTARGSRGVGGEALLLLASRWRRWNATVNAGGLVDPATPDAGKPLAVEGGLDLARPLGASRFTLTAELGGVRFVGPGPRPPHQLAATAGAAWAVGSALELSLVGLVGFVDGSDRWGLLLGVSPTIRAFSATP
jgi:hypothetical protein